MNETKSCENCKYYLNVDDAFFDCVKMDCGFNKQCHRLSLPSICKHYAEPKPEPSEFERFVRKHLQKRYGKSQDEYDWNKPWTDFKEEWENEIGLILDGYKQRGEDDVKAVVDVFYTTLKEKPTGRIYRHDAIEAIRKRDEEVNDGCE